MLTLQELYKNRQSQIQNRNGTEPLLKRIEILKTLVGEERQKQAERLKGYIEAMFDHQELTFTDAKDWEIIVDQIAQGRI